MARRATTGVARSLEMRGPPRRSVRDTRRHLQLVHRGLRYRRPEGRQGAARGIERVIGSPSALTRLVGSEDREPHDEPGAAGMDHCGRDFRHDVLYLGCHQLRRSFLRAGSQALRMDARATLSCVLDRMDHGRCGRTPHRMAR